MKGRLVRWHIKRMQIDGPRLERWFLKTLINLTFNGEYPMDHEGSHRKGIPSQELVEVVFGLRQFKNGAGLYLEARSGQQIDSMDRVNFTPLTDEQNNLVAGQFNFRGYTFFLCLIPERFQMLGDSHLLHQQVTLNCRVRQQLSHVIAIRGWEQ